jgi:outer membrane protein assembly factor BamD (BamD/ComL family)
VISLLHDGALDDAKLVLDRLDPDQNGVTEYRWRAEWNLITCLKADGRTEEAFSRVRNIIKNDSRTGGVLPVDLILRLRWLEAQLALEVGRPSEAAEHADNLLEALKGASINQLQKKELESLLAGAMLLKVQSLLAQKKYEESVPYFQKLRGEHPGTNFAQRSYLLEAAYHSQADDLVKAQQLSVKLADDFPENPLAPIALMEAAQFAEKRGSENFFKEALNLLERLANQYPKHELVYYARLRQGHLFRKLNQFGNAQQIYSNLINLFPDHNEIHLALLANADCQLAQAGDDGVRFEVAANLLERLFLQPNLHPDVAVEAGYKLSFVHRQRQNVSQAQEVLGAVLDRFLLNQVAEGKPLGASGRYWMSRTILALGTLLEDGSVLDEARIVYGLIGENNLPGRSLANSRINKLGI